MAFMPAAACSLLKHTLLTDAISFRLRSKVGGILKQKIRAAGEAVSHDKWQRVVYAYFAMKD